MEFKVNCGIWGAMFGVPIIVADNFLKLATGGQIKVLLYLLRYSGKMCSTEDISTNTGVSPEEAEEAVLFWQQANVLSPQTSGAPAPVPSLMAQPSQSVEAPASGQIHKETEPAPNHKISLSAKEIADIMNGSQDIRELFRIIESILGSLSNGQMNSIIWMYDHLGLKKEVISTLFSFCQQIEKTNTAYIEKIAVSWAEKEINSLEAATDEKQKLLTSRDFTSQVARTLELSPPITQNKKDIIEQWRTLGFSIELIRYAYEKALDIEAKLPFFYANKTLLKWHDKGITTVEEAKNDNNEYKTKRASSNSDNSTDIEEYKSVINKFLY